MINDLTPGTILLSRYTIVREIASGGMGKVYLAEDARLANRKFAVKIPLMNLPPQDLQMAMDAFNREVGILTQLTHPNIAHIHDSFTESGQPHLVIEYVDGQSLDRIIKTKGKVDEDNMIDWAQQVIDILNYLHGRNPPVIYRDLKPANLMLDSGGHIKLIDFGITRVFKPGRAGGDTINLGTPGYAPPEAYGDRSIQTDQRSDLYSLGVMMHYLLTGVDPEMRGSFIFDSMVSLDPAISPVLDSIVMKCVNTNPDLRYQTATELGTDLKSYSIGVLHGVTTPTQSQQPQYATPQFCATGCGNPIKYKCAICGRLVCEGHGENARVLLARRAFSDKESQNLFIQATTPDLQQAWCTECFQGLPDEDTTAAIACALEDSDKDIRKVATVALKNVGHPAAVPFIIQELRDNDAGVRETAAVALGQLGDTSAIPCLLTGMNDSNTRARSAAVAALDRIADSSAMQGLADAMINNTDGQIRESALKILRRYNERSLVPYFTLALDDGDSNVRKNAIAALQPYKDNATIGPLTKSLSDPVEAVREQAMDALTLFGDDAVSVLVCAVNDNAFAGKEYAATVLDRIADPESVEIAGEARRRWHVESELHMYEADEFYRRKTAIFVLDLILGLFIPAGLYGIKFLVKYPKCKTCVTYGCILLLETLAVFMLLILGRIWVNLVFWIAGLAVVGWYAHANWNN